MGNKEQLQVNWEKIGVYVAITLALFTLITYHFEAKEEISCLRERVAKLEVKVDHLEN